MKKHTIASSYRLDQKDRKIIAALKEDGRMPFAEIARRLGVSQGMVRQRYLQLVEDGVLRVVPVTNPTLMGYQVMALIGVRADNRLLREVVERLSALDMVTYLVMCTGAYEILVEVICRDQADLLQFLTTALD